MYVALTLAGLGCVSRQLPRYEPQPRVPPTYSQRDSAALALLDSLIVVMPFRSTCPMPVARGDSSHDTLMVPRIRVPRRSTAGPPCFNPRFRLAPTLPPNKRLKLPGATQVG